MLGLTPERIRERVVRLIGERNMAIIEGVWGAVKLLIDGGPAALWEKIKEYVGNLKDMLVDAIQEWVVTKIIQAAVTKLVSMFNPVGAIIQAIIAIYNTVMFFVERINQILEFVEAVVNSVDKIARGAIGDAASWIEKALARTIPVIISFLARLIGLGGVSEKVKGFILKLQTKVEGAIDKVIEKILGGIKKIAGAVFGAGKAAVAAVFEWWKKKMKVGKGKNTHTLYFRGEQGKAKLYIESTPRILRDYVADLRGDVDYQGADQLKILKRIDNRIDDIEDDQDKLTIANDRNHVHVAANLGVKISNSFEYIGKQLGDLFEGDTYGTETDPIDIDWPGPKSSQYRVLYFGGRLPDSRLPKSQTVMRVIHDKGQKDETGNPVKKYTPHGSDNQLKDGKTIGITPEFRLTEGTVVGPLTQEGTSSGDKLQRRIEPYGYNSKQDGLELDHVREIQFGGREQNDKVGNLWPLEQSRNSSKGPTLAGASVEYPRGHTTTIRTLKLVKNDDVKQRKKFFFRVKSTGPGDK